MPAGPTPEEVRAAHVANLLSQGNPFMPRGQGQDLTRQMLLRQVDPAVADAQLALAAPYLQG